jgi:hypothetical protein
MLDIFFDAQGFVQYEFIPEGRTVKEYVYIEILRRLRDTVRREYPEKWTRNSWFLLHYNAHALRLPVVKHSQCLARHSVMDVEHPSYFPNL